MDYKFGLLFYFMIVKYAIYIIAVEILFGIFYKWIWKKIFSFHKKIK